MHKIAFAPLGLFLLLIIGSIASLLWQLDWPSVQQVIFEPEIHFALSLSFGAALSSLLLALVIGIPAAWTMARHEFAGKKLINTLLDLPMVTPPLVVGIGLLLFLGNSGPGGWLFPKFAEKLFSATGVIIAQTYVASSIIVRSAVSAFNQIDRNYINCAYNLGLSPWKTMFIVEIPLCWRALAGGCVIALSRSLGEFGATLMLAGATRMKTETLPMAVYLNISSGDFSIAIGCASLLIIIACCLLFLLHIFQKNDAVAYVDR